MAEEREDLGQETVQLQQISGRKVSGKVVKVQVEVVSTNDTGEEDRSGCEGECAMVVVSECVQASDDRQAGIDKIHIELMVDSPMDAIGMGYALLFQLEKNFGLKFVQTLFSLYIENRDKRGLR